MLTYVYIALGGAIGSVARAWTTEAVMRAMGPDFPWGTILINVIGSFIIGLFGALTTSDARFPVHGDARAFVMIGICGGYTTFSSFSLQTLDLARDGKLAAAFANIALSVVLCLAAVTAGYASATVLNGRVPATRAVEQRGEGHVVLAVLNNPETANGLLSSAATLLNLLGGSGCINVLCARTPPVSTLMLADQPVTPAEEQRLRSLEIAWAAEVKARVEQWKAQARSEPIEIEWLDIEGDAAHLTAEYGRASDAVLILGPPHLSRRAHDVSHAAIFNTSRPVLVTPSNGLGEFGSVVAVAWKDDLGAPKAVLDAMPILKGAKAIHVLRASISDDELSLPAIFQEHGIVASLHVIPSQNGEVGKRLLDFAHYLRADLIVMGAYAHGEWREALFGGVTAYMLAHADLPLFMRH